jgi:hypothetical protein
MKTGNYWVNMIIISKVCSLLIVACVMVGTPLAQEYDPSSNNAPLSSREKHPIRMGASWANVIQSDPLGKCRLFVGLSHGRQVNIRLQLENSSHKKYEIWRRNDTLVDLKVIDCATRDCSDWHKEGKFLWPRHFILRIFINTDSAIYKIDVDKNNSVPIVIPDSASRGLFEVIILRQIPSAPLIFVQFIGKQLELVKNLDSSLNEIAEPVLLPIGYYDLNGQMVGVEVHKVIRRRESSIEYNVSPYGTVLFYKPTSGRTIEQVAAMLTTFWQTSKLEQNRDYIWGLLE